jgi:hypothetical protein
MLASYFVLLASNLTMAVDDKGGAQIRNRGNTVLAPLLCEIELASFTRLPRLVPKSQGGTGQSSDNGNHGSPHAAYLTGKAARWHQCRLRILSAIRRVQA